MDCPVCTISYTKSARKQVDCPSCQFQCCRKCVQTHLTSCVQPAHCMHCKTPWSRNFLSGVMTKKFIKVDYRKHREKVLLELEKELLPTAVPYVESFRRKKKMSQERNELLNRLNNLGHRVYLEDEFLVGRGEDPSTMDDSQMLIEEENEVESGACSYGTRGYCPRNDCNGLIGKSWRCVTCDVLVCKTCTVMIDETCTEKHLCKPEDIETVKSIRKDCKPCPSCRVRVFKIEGCNQMFCVHCNTAFDWASLRILKTKDIHNPHYTEFVLSGNSSSGNVSRCGEAPSPNEILRAFELNELFNKDFFKYKRGNTLDYNQNSFRVNSMASYILDSLRVSNHILHVVLRETLQPNMERIPLEYRHCRVEYLTNIKTEEEFQKSIQRINKKEEKTRAIMDLCDMYSISIKNLLVNFTDDHKNIDHLYEELCRLHQYAIKSYKELSDTFGGAPDMSWYIPEPRSGLFIEPQFIIR